MNDHNPYAPPVSEVADAATSSPAARKPVSVWLLQIACVLLALLLVPGLAASYGKWQAAAGMARMANLIALLLLMLVVTILLCTVMAAQRRSQFGRWLGVFIMGSVVAIVAVVVANSDFHGHMPDAAVAGFYGAAALFVIPAALLLYFSAFSKRARAWYGKS